MKKLVLAIMILGSVSVYAQEKLVIDKQVTGINKETIETRQLENNVNLKEAKVSGKDIKISNKKIQKSEENLEVKNQNENLKKELATDVEKESSIWKFIIGALGVIAVAIAL